MSLMTRTAGVLMCRAFCTLTIFTALLAAPGVALGEDAISAPAQKAIGESPKNEMIPSLAVINSHAATMQGNALILTGVSPKETLIKSHSTRLTNGY